MDSDGVTPIVTVPMHNGDHNAVLDLADFNELMALKVSPLWRFVSGMVFECGASKISIARLVCDCGVKQKVQFLSGNPLDLRRFNLVVTKGAGKYRARDQLIRDPAILILKEKVEIKPIYINPPYMTQLQDSLKS